MFSSTGGFGACALMVANVWYSISPTALPTSTFPLACVTFEWVSPFEIRCTLPPIDAYNIVRGQVSMLGVRGPGSATTIYSQTKRRLVAGSVPAALVTETGTMTRPNFATQENPSPRKMRISVVSARACDHARAPVLAAL
jgi:hypothetical protein